MDLARHLRTWSPNQLGRLLEHRPDLLPATDRGIDAVARKATTAVSMGRVLVEADVAMLVVAQALAAEHPNDVDGLDELLGTGDPLAVVEAVERLAERGVVVVDHGLVHPVGALTDLLHRPLGLGPSFAELVDNLDTGVLERLARDTRAGGGGRSTTARAVARRLRDPGVVAELLADGPPGVDELLAELAALRSPAIVVPDGPLPGRARTGAGGPIDPDHPTDPDHRDPDQALAWLVERGLVIPVRDGGAELPRELVIAAHPDGLAPQAALRPVPLDPEPGLSAETVAGAGADAANRALDGAQALLDQVGRGEVALRRAGGVGPRELARLAGLLGLGATEVAQLLDLLDLARLIDLEDGAVVPTTLAERWWRLDRARRLLVLIRAWVGADRFLPVGQTALVRRDPTDPTTDDTGAAAAAAARAITVATMVRTDRGQAWRPDRLAATVVWQAPNLWGAGDPPPEDLVERMVAEATLLGLTVEGAPTDLCRALVDQLPDGAAVGDDAELVAASVAAVGQDQDTVVLQSDLSALSFGPLAPAVARRLAEMADRSIVGDGRTPTFRFTEASLRRALDDGWTPEGLTSFLTDHALAGLPQPLTYLIEDVARRHGTVRVLGASSVIVTDEDVTAVEIGTHRRASVIGLRLVAPTVLVAPIDPVTLVDELRAMGFLPVLDGPALRVGRSDRGGGATTDTATPDDVEADGPSDGPDPEGAPAHWLAPPLPTGPLPDEVADAVAALLQVEPGPVGNDATEAVEPTTWTRHWGRPVRVRALIDGRSSEATGVVVGLDRGVAVLTTTGVVELPGESIIDITPT